MHPVKLLLVVLLALSATLSVVGIAHASIASDPGNCHSSAQGLASSGHTCPVVNPGNGH